MLLIFILFLCQDPRIGVMPTLGIAAYVTITVHQG